VISDGKMEGWMDGKREGRMEGWKDGKREGRKVRKEDREERGGNRSSCRVAPS
jgi:hypothetical protein